MMKWKTAKAALVLVSALLVFSCDRSAGEYLTNAVAVVRALTGTDDGERAPRAPEPVMATGEYGTTEREPRGAEPGAPAGRSVPVGPVVLSSPGEQVEPVAAPADTRSEAGSRVGEVSARNPAEAVKAEPEEKSVAGSARKAEPAPVPPPAPPPEISYSIRTVPTDAVIRIGAVAEAPVAGQGFVSGIAAAGTEITAVIERTHYRSLRHVFRVSSASDNAYRFELERLFKRIKVSALPVDALVTLDSAQTGRGSVERNVALGGSLRIAISRPGYEPVSDTVTIDPGTPGILAYTLLRSRRAISVAAEPPDAEIFLDGAYVGRGTYEGVFPVDALLSFGFTMPGYVAREIPVRVPSQGRGAFTVRLEEQTWRLEITTTPDDAVIALDGKRVGIGRHIAFYRHGVPLAFTFSHPEYHEKILELVVDREETGIIAVALVQKPIVASARVSGRKIVGLALYAGKHIIAVDNDGIVYALDRNGTVRWKVRSGNEPHENSALTIEGGTLYLTGLSYLTAIDCEQGTVLYRVPLERSSGHMFGRHPIRFRDRLLVPENDVMKILERADGSLVKTIGVPGGSWVTPALYRDLVLTVNMRGDLIALDSDTGALVFSLPTPAEHPMETSILVRDGTAWIVGRKGTLVAVDLEKRALLWAEDTLERKGFAVMHDIEPGDGVLYLYAKSAVHTFSIDGGRFLGSVEGAASTPPRYVHDRLLYGAPDGSLRILDARTMLPAGRIDLHELVTTRPLPFGKLIVCGTSNGTVYILNPEGAE